MKVARSLWAVYVCLLPAVIFYVEAYSFVLAAPGSTTPIIFATTPINDTEVVAVNASNFWSKETWIPYWRCLKLVAWLSFNVRPASK